MNYLPKLIGPRVMEANTIRASILRFLDHTRHIQIDPIRGRINRVVHFVETQRNTSWFLDNAFLTRDCESALAAVTKIGEENGLF